MNWKRLPHLLFGARSDPNFQVISFPVYLIPIVVLAVSFGAYILGNTHYEDEIRMTSLLVSGFSLITVIAYLLHPGLARWVVAFCLSGVVIGAAWIWASPDLFFLLVLSPLLAVILINTPSGFMLAILNSLVVGNIARTVGLELNQPVLQLLIWLVTLVAMGGYLLVEGVLRYVSQDYERMRELLESSRVQQARVAEVMDDLEHANRQLSLLFERNISLRKLAEEATEAKSTYIAKVSHEIRTPLSMILGITDLIIENEEEYDENLPMDLLEDIRIIRRNSDHLLGLVNDVLDLTRAETGYLVLKKDWVNINQEIEQSLEIVQPLARKKRLQLQFQAQNTLPLVYCDQTRIRQVVVNLLSNAVRYTEHGMVSVRVHSDEQWLSVEVQDTGQGIHPGDEERIFEPFFRGTNTMRLESSGSGLGLSVSRQLLELHGGKIWVESQPGAGSSFFFRLPVNDLQPPRQSPAGFINEKWAWVERKRRPSGEKNPGKKRVILCESDDFLTSQFQGRESQAEFVQLKTIPEAVEDANTIPAHLVLVNDSNLKELLLKMAQAAKGIKETPIIGCAFTPPREKIIETGALEYVQKPFSIKQLRSTLQRVSPTLNRILIVDDNIEIQHLIARVLSLLNDPVEILLALSGAEALEILSRKQPDAILLDLALPDTDGWQLMTQIKKDSSLASIPIIIISSHDISDSPPNTQSIVVTQNRGFTLEQFITFTTKNLIGPPGAGG